MAEGRRRTICSESGSGIGGLADVCLLPSAVRRRRSGASQRHLGHGVEVGDGEERGPDEALANEGGDEPEPEA